MLEPQIELHAVRGAGRQVTGEVRQVNLSVKVCLPSVWNLLICSKHLLSQSSYIKLPICIETVPYKIYICMQNKLLLCL